MSEHFAAVEWMRKRREVIDREDEGLSWVERSQKTLHLLERDPLWKTLASGALKPASDPTPAGR